VDRVVQGARVLAEEFITHARRAALNDRNP
jgi:hypothetical protein